MQSIVSLHYVEYHKKLPAKIQMKSGGTKGDVNYATHNVCNDNGIAENLPLNRMLGDYDIIHGTFFVCGLTSNDFTDLTPKQMKHYEELYHDPQLFFLLGKTLCVEHTTPEEYARVMTPPPNTKESHER